MRNMVLGDEAVTDMYKYLNRKIESLGVDKGKVYKYERPEKMEHVSYIAINHLPFVRRDVIEEGTVNVNIHVPKTSTNMPNVGKLQNIAKAIIAPFDIDGGLYLGKCIFEFYADSRPTLDNDDTYYINLKFNVIYNNLKA